jgi:hypothetical protein
MKCNANQLPVHVRLCHGRRGGAAGRGPKLGDMVPSHA